jgi:hypothetical protein
MWEWLKKRLTLTEQEIKYQRIGRRARLFTVFTLLLFTPMVAKASYPSWVGAIDGGMYDNAYDYLNKTESESKMSSAETKTSEDTVNDKVGNVFDSIGSWIAAALYSVNQDYSISIDGTVLGRLAGYKVSVAKFELAERNPYGVIGAYLYVTLRNICFALLLIGFVISIARHALTHNGKEMLEAKETLKTLVFVFALLYFMPIITHWFISFRDSAILMFSSMVLGQEMKFASIMQYFIVIQASVDNGTLGGILMYLALGLGGVFVAASYVGIAVLCMGYFAAFPVVAVLALKDKTIIKAWARAFYTNLTVPLIDFSFLFLAVALTAILNQGGMLEHHGFTLSFIWCFIIWGFQPARNILIRLFGGAAPASGAGMLAAGAMMALRAGLSKGKGSGNGASNNSESLESRNEDSLRQRSENYTEASRDNFNQLNDLGNSTDVGEARIGSLDDNLSMPTELDYESGNGGIENAELGSLTAESGGEMPGVGQPSIMDGVEANSNVEESTMLGTDSTTGDIETADLRGTTPSVSDGFDSITSEDGHITYEDNAQMRLDNLEACDRLERVAAGGGVDTKDIGMLQNEVAKYDNVAKSYTANASEIQHLQATNKSLNMAMEKASASGEQYAHVGGVAYAIPEARAQIDRNNEKIKALESTNSGLSQTMNSSQWQQGRATATARLDEANRIYSMTAENAKVELHDRRTVERSFATQDKINGGSGVTYSDAASYRQVMRDNDVKRANVNYQNYNSKEYAGVTTAHEKQMYADYKKKADAVATGAKIVAGAAGALALGAAGTFGGPSTMMAGAMIGSKTGDAARNGVEEIAKTRQFTDTRKAPKKSSTTTSTPPDDTTFTINSRPKGGPKPTSFTINSKADK